MVKTSTQDASSLQWIVDAYSLVFAGLLLTAGALGDRYRPAPRAAMAAWSSSASRRGWPRSPARPSQLIVARAVMGIGAAFVMPATLSVLAHVFPPDERPRAIAIWAGFAGVGAALGGVISGWLLEHFWWGSIFLTNVVVVVDRTGRGRLPRAVREGRSDAPRSTRSARCCRSPGWAR